MNIASLTGQELIPGDAAAKRAQAMKRMSPEQMMKAELAADNVNTKLGVREAGENQKLGKDSFLKLLVTELQHQDPTKPMEDREFIAQMAQFSSLEQMTNMNNHFGALLQKMESTGAYNLLGKEIDAYNVEKKQIISGVVDAIEHSGGNIYAKVGQTQVLLQDIHSVYNSKEEKAATVEVE